MKRKSIIPYNLRNRGWLSKAAGSFSHTPQRTVQLWTERGCIVPEISDTTGTGDRRLYSVKNCIEIGIIRSLSRLRLSHKLINLVMFGLRNVNALRKEEASLLEKMLSFDQALLAIPCEEDSLSSVAVGSIFRPFLTNYGQQWNQVNVNEWFKHTLSEDANETLILNISRIARQVLHAIETAG